MIDADDRHAADVAVGVLLTLAAAVFVGLGSGSPMAGALIVLIPLFVVGIVGVLASLVGHDVKRGMWLGYHWTIGFIARWFSF